MSGKIALFVPIDAFIKDYGWRVSVVKEDEWGHSPTGDWPNDGTGRMPWFVPGPSYEEAEKQVDQMNERLGLDKKAAGLIVLSSMGRKAPRRRRHQVPR